MATLQEPDLAFVPTCTTRFPVVLPDGLSLDGSIRSLRNECKLAWHARDIRRMGSATDLHDYDSDVGGSNDRRVATSFALRKTAAGLWHGQSNRCYCPIGSWQPVGRSLERLRSMGIGDDHAPGQRIRKLLQPARRLVRLASAFCHFSRDSDRGFAPLRAKTDPNSRRARARQRKRWLRGELQKNQMEN